MSRRRWLSLCAFSALSSILQASDERTHAAPADSPVADTAGERAAPELFSWGDLDGDGRLDLAVVDGQGELQLLASSGGGRFEDVTERAGLTAVGRVALALWADYDGDGRFDLFVGARAGASHLFHNEGGSFVDMSAGSGLTSEGAVQSAQWLDYDGDGRLDLFVVTADGATRSSLIFRGLEGGFFERTELPSAGGVQIPLLGMGPSGANEVDRGAVGGSETGAPVAPGSSGGGSRDTEGRSIGGKQARGVNASGGPIVRVPSPGDPIPIPLAPTPSCVYSLRDAVTVNPCISASKVPTLGMLYPLSVNLFVASGGNVGIGTTSPTAKLHVAGTVRVTPSGDQALDVSTGSIYKGGLPFIHTKGGSRNTALGREALMTVTSGFQNTASGYRALRFDTTGHYNTASGASALAANTTGFGNTASGADALTSNTSGTDNSGFGRLALFKNTTGYTNHAGGSRALYENTTGSLNTASGAEALSSNTTGARNTACGTVSLLLNQTGSDNIALGYLAGYQTTGDDNIAIGHAGVPSENGTIRMGSPGTHTRTFIAGIRGVTTGVADAVPVGVDSAGQLGTLSSLAVVDGNVGIGTTSPAARLDVAGTARMTGTLTLAPSVGQALDVTGAASITGTLTLAPSVDQALDVSTGSIYKSGALFIHTKGGVENTAIGSQALTAVTSGRQNTAIGYKALYSIGTGFENTASGAQALSANSSGRGNTANGFRALFYNVSEENTASGNRALFNNTTGHHNTATGYLALGTNTVGSRNIALGAAAGAFLTSGDDNIVVGNSGVAGESGTIRIGTNGTHTRAFVAGIRGVTTGVADGVPVVIDSAGQLGTVSSSRRFKEDIRDMGDATERLLELRPVLFRYKQEQTLPGGREVPPEYGLIAEEVAEVFPDLVVYDEQGLPFTVKYHLLSSMLLNELKKQAEEVADLRGRLETQGASQGRLLEELRTRLAVLERSSSTASAAPLAPCVPE